VRVLNGNEDMEGVVKKYNVGDNIIYKLLRRRELLQGNI